MWDFRGNPEIQNLVARVYEDNGYVAAVCHGPAALVDVKLSDGSFLVSGKRVAGFSNAEEEGAGLTEVMPFLLESELVANGAKYEKAGLWQKKVIQDGRLITGQNPASAESVGTFLADALKSSVI
jgi:putative intracellular protease/amidase